jgi:hypothetical protein
VSASSTPYVPQSENGGLHPELAATITAASAALADFRREDEQHAANPLATRPDYRSWCYRLAADMNRLLRLIEGTART